MDRQALDWQLCRSFLAVMEEGSASGAARQLGLTQPTVGRHIELMEAQLGIPLFMRGTTGLRPTEAALGLLPHARSMAAAADAMARMASGEAEEARGTVRLAVSEFMGVHALPPMLSRFHEAHPGIAIELALSNRAEDLLRREADMAVRMVEPTQSQLIARWIGTIPIRLYAHEAYAACHGLPKTLEELTRHTIIGYDTNRFAIDRMRAQGVEVDRSAFVYRTDSDCAQAAALLAGFGIGGAQVPFAERFPELKPVMHGIIEFDLPTWLVMHEDLKASRRVRLLFDHLVEELKAYVALCA